MKLLRIIPFTDVDRKQNVYGINTLIRIGVIAHTLKHLTWEPSGIKLLPH